MANSQPYQEKCLQTADEADVTGVTEAPSILGSRGYRLFIEQLTLGTNKPAITSHHLPTEAKSQQWDLPHSRSVDNQTHVYNVR